MDLGFGNPIKPVHSFPLGCIHYFSEVETVAFFKISKKLMTFQKRKGPRPRGLKKKTRKEQALLQLARLFPSNTVECHLHTTHRWKLRSPTHELIILYPYPLPPVLREGHWQLPSYL